MFCKCPIDFNPWVTIFLNNERQPKTTFHKSVKYLGDSNQEYSALFYQCGHFIQKLNENPVKPSEITINVFAGDCDIEIRTIELILHYKKRNHLSSNLSFGSDIEKLGMEMSTN